MSEIDIDVGIILLGFAFSIIGAVVQFWQTIIQKQMKGMNKGLNEIITDIKSNTDLKKEIGSLILKNKIARRNAIKSFLSTKSKEIRSAERVTWTITIFFGLIAGMIYLLITEFVIELPFFIGSFAAGYSGESFVLGALKEQVDTEFTVDEFRAQLKHTES
ncbi:MAG: hypothetical protein ACXAD7_00455 [Candidatus Kariarchaeaceae archaeon]|jgi:hypothetical protein